MAKGQIGERSGHPHRKSGVGQFPDKPADAYPCYLNDCGFKGHHPLVEHHDGSTRCLCWRHKNDPRFARIIAENNANQRARRALANRPRRRPGGRKV